MRILQPEVGQSFLVAAGFLAGAVLLFPPLAQAQQPELRQVMDRLDRLETQNQELLTEIRALRQQLSLSQPPSPAATAEASPPAIAGERAEVQAGERAEVQERRLADLDQSKVQSEHRLPVSLTGTVLFNAFLNGRGSGGAQYPLLAAPGSQASGGATMRQTVLGLKFDGPEIAGGGKIRGSIYMDFFSGNTGLSQTLRLRLANVEAAWKYTTVSLAFDKPIIAPREPDSLAQVGVSPLTASGNLWLWQPQARVEQRVPFGNHAGLRAQFGVYQTGEGGAGVPAEYSSTLAPARPGYEGRFELWSQLGENRRIEIAPGFHQSSSRVVGQSVPSQIFSLDWLIRPVARIDFTGAFFQGQNVGVLGALRQSVTIRNGAAIPVQSLGGWAQVKVRITPRLALDGFGGEQDDRNRDLNSGGVAKNLSYGANLMYRVGSNVLTGLEASQVRTTYLGAGTRINPHYDLAIAYLF